VRSRAEPKNHPEERRKAVARFFHGASTEALRRSIAARFDVRYVIARSPGLQPSAVAGSLSRDPAFRHLRTIHHAGVSYAVFERMPAI